MREHVDQQERAWFGASLPRYPGSPWTYFTIGRRDWKIKNATSGDLAGPHDETRLRPLTRPAPELF
jgi:hypothetical protein